MANTENEYRLQGNSYFTQMQKELHSINFHRKINLNACCMLQM